jgi:hypothetical protein
MFRGVRGGREYTSCLTAQGAAHRCVSAPFEDPTTTAGYRRRGEMSGCSEWRILRRHVLPNAAGP